MSDVVLVAAISAGAALATALLTQYLATRAANRSADRADKREALQWQRTEALRLEELQRKQAEAEMARLRQQADKQQEQLQARLRELWTHVLTARWQVEDALGRVPVQGKATPKAEALSAEHLPVHAAGRAYSVALLGLADVRPTAKAFYMATSQLQSAFSVVDADRLEAAGRAWSNAYAELEAAVSALVDNAEMSRGQIFEQ